MGKNFKPWHPSQARKAIAWLEQDYDSFVVEESCLDWHEDGICYLELDEGVLSETPHLWSKYIKSVNARPMFELLLPEVGCWAWVHSAGRIPANDAIMGSVFSMSEYVDMVMFKHGQDRGPEGVK